MPRLERWLGDAALVLRYCCPDAEQLLKRILYKCCADHDKIKMKCYGCASVKQALCYYSEGAVWEECGWRMGAIRVLYG